MGHTHVEESQQGSHGPANQNKSHSQLGITRCTGGLQWIQHLHLDALQPDEQMNTGKDEQADVLDAARATESEKQVKPGCNGPALQPVSQSQMH